VKSFLSVKFALRNKFLQPVERTSMRACPDGQVYACVVGSV